MLRLALRGRIQVAKKKQGGEGGLVIEARSARPLGQGALGGSLLAFYFRLLAAQQLATYRPTKTRRKTRVLQLGAPHK